MVNATAYQNYQRKQDQIRQVRRGKTKIVSIPAPIGGLNTRDRYGEMPDTDAPTLINMFPTSGDLKLRNGYTSHSSGVGSGNVTMIAEFKNGTTQKLIAASATNLYDATSDEDAASSIKASLTGDGRWSWVMMVGKMGLVNGTDTPLTYDGSSIANMTVSGTGLTVTNLKHVNVFKNRSYFIEKNTQNCWYSAAGALGGSLTKFDMSGVANFGGNLVSSHTWTIDGGAGPDDFMVFIFELGQVAIYKGTDAGASDWTLVGVYDMGSPVDSHSVVKLGGDLVILTREDYVHLTQETLRAGQGLRKRTKMSGLVQSDVATYAANAGWEGHLYPAGSMLLFNVPISTTQFKQHVMNTTTGAWTTFEDIPSSTWGMYNNNLYFGDTSGKIFKFDTGSKDDEAAINFEAQTAWNALDYGAMKRITAIRPYFIHESTLTLDVGLGFDFEDITTSLTAESEAQIGGSWDTAEWDDAYWPDEQKVNRVFLMVRGFGATVSVKLSAQVKNQNVSWHRLDYLYEPGGAM